MRRRVAVTGIGVVCPVGNDADTMWRALLEGHSGVEFITEFPTDKLRSNIAANVKGFDPLRFLTPKEAELYGRVTHFSIGAAIEAIEQAGLGALRRGNANTPARDEEEEGEAGPGNTSEFENNSDGRHFDFSAALPGGFTIDRAKIGCLMSSGMGSVDIFEQQVKKSAERGPRAVSPYFVPGVMPNGAAALIAIRYGFMGPSYSLASACATGTHSIVTSSLMIESGEADIMIAGGAEAATRTNTVAGFGNARALARAYEGSPERASRPFDRDRQGFVMAEGAGALVLEAEEHAKQRGAPIFAYVAGFGMTTDAEHLTRPHSEGSGLALAIMRALSRANIKPDDIGYINPHATSTLQGDIAEYKALLRIFGGRLGKIPISATKSMLGHLLGGAGAVEAIATVCALRDQVLHPSINVDEKDPALSLFNIVREKMRADVRYALKCSAGFGGHNCVLVLERARD